MDRDYDQDEQLAAQFLAEFYQERLTQIANREEIHLTVDLKDLELFNSELAAAVVSNTTRYTSIFLAALDKVLPSFKTKDVDLKDPIDCFIQHRRLNAERNQDKEGTYPPDLIRRAELYFKPSNLEPIPIRQVKAEHVGKLVTIRGIVTRATEVKPQVTVTCYTCDLCGFETFQTVRGEFMPLNKCTSAACEANKTLGRLTLQTRGSKFVKFQDLRLQEHSDQVPAGHIPRTIVVIAHGEQTRRCTPGDHVSISGVFLTVEKFGFRARHHGLAADVFIEAQHISLMNKTEDAELSSEPMSDEEACDFIANQRDFLAKLSSSIAPEIYGHNDLKKALLLLLIGGVDNQRESGMKIRGNINICLMGDPGVAKSQLLSFVDRLALRSQYTTGRGSSGVGLTAAVLKDPTTNELILEGGALVLADKGICCIDEFDKMNEADRTAIHEVMEQQTVSIAKAGIMTTLNARVSILAAANPAAGRYNMNRTVSDNLNLPPALLSRFDLLWLIKDKPDISRDKELAHHVTMVHSDPSSAAIQHDCIDMKVLRRYLNLCQTRNPIVPRNLTNRLLEIYMHIRSSKANKHKSDTLFTSPRSLLSIIRLSTALAKLRLAEEVAEDDVEGAFYLYNKSRESIEGNVKTGESLSGKMWKMITEYAKENNVESMPKDFIIGRLLDEDHNEKEIREALDELLEYDNIQIVDDEVIII